MIKKFFLALGLLAVFSHAVLAEDAAAPTAKTRSIAVLMERKSVDDLITSADVTQIDVEKAPADAITDPQQIIGKAPRRPINADQPIRPTDLKPFTVIKKGELVTISLATPNMDLTVSGKALDNGAMGDTIRVTNQSSNRTIFAKVTGPNAVRIDSAQ